MVLHCPQIFEIVKAVEDKNGWNKDERKKKRWRNKKYVRCGRRE